LFVKSPKVHNNFLIAAKIDTPYQDQNDKTFSVDDIIRKIENNFLRERDAFLDFYLNVFNAFVKFVNKYHTKLAFYFVIE